MNGRVYDPNLGRFLSVDPVFAFPTNTQSLNPYSYVLNNPLSMVDPSGYSPKVACTDNGKTTTCSGNVETTGSHIPQKVTASRSDKGGEVKFSGPLASPGGNSLSMGSTTLTANVSTGNGAQNRNQTNDPQNKPKDASSIGGPADASFKCAAQLSCNMQSNSADFVNPSGGGVRNDPTGGGYYDSPRHDPDGTIREHQAIDFTAKPGQSIEAPISGKVRVLIVYGKKFTGADSRLSKFRGVEITGQDQYGFPTGFLQSYFMYLLRQGYLMKLSQLGT